MKIILSILVLCATIFIHSCKKQSSTEFKSLPDISWQKVGNFEHKRIYSINVHPDGSVYVITSDSLGRSALFVSEDNGGSWQFVPVTEDNEFIIGLTYNDKGDIFLQKQHSVYKTSDYTNWQKILDLDVRPIYLLLVLEQNVYVITSDKLYTSNDNGNTWEEKGSLPFTAYGYYRSITVSPKNKILLGTNGFGVFRLSDDQSEWYQIKDLAETYIESFAIDSNGNMYAVDNYDGLFYRSLDYGKSWNFTSTLDNNTFKIIINKNDNIFAGTYSKGVLRSTDGGSNWESVSEDLPPMMIFGLAEDQSGYIYVGDGHPDDQKGLFRTVDPATY